ncbi:MAG: YmfQ family protein [Peptoanaerobacter stomatis]|uniref:YmfQ family protein n=1 Tax=Peptoanaerobacter stomatis TaxID=796937 RepID=UPI003FA05746
MSECNKDLMKYLPLYWHDIKEMIVLLKSLGIEIGELDLKLKDIFSQCFIETATWGLGLWEREIDLKTDLSLSYEHRREMIKAKLRGSSTTTKEMIANVAKAFSNGEVEVIEHNEKYFFEIKFIGTRGIPANMAGLKSILEEIKPAHLGVKYSYIFAVWEHLKLLTWNTIKRNNINWFKAKLIDKDSFNLWDKQVESIWQNNNNTWDVLDTIELFKN